MAASRGISCRRDSTRRELYNLHRAIATGERGYVVEGFFDCMKVHQAGFPFVVALMGCSMSEEQERLLVAHAEMVLLMLDGDEAGRQGNGGDSTAPGTASLV